MSRRRIKGAARVRSLLKRIEPAMRDEMIGVLTDAGQVLSAEIRAAEPVLQKPRAGRIAGALAAAISFKVYPKTLKLRVGLVGKAANRNFFYGRILEFGRGIRKKIDSRGRRIGVIAPVRAVLARRPDLRRALGNRIKGIWGRALQKAAAGAGSAND